MGINLTEGAVTRIMKKEVSTEKDLKPLLQVIELKEVLTTSKNPNQQQQEHRKSERYRLLLSDGSTTQQGMLATSKNELVKASKLQVGSIIQLTQYICNVIQERMIVIIMELDVIVEKYDIIGKPVPAPRSSRPTQVTTDQPGNVMAHTNSLGASPVGGGMGHNLNSAGMAHTNSLGASPVGGGMAHNLNSAGMAHTNSLGASPVGGGMAHNLNSAGNTLQQPRMNQWHGTSRPSGSEQIKYPSANAPALYPKAEASYGFPGSSPLNGPYGAQSTGFQNPRPASSRPLSTSNLQSVPIYQQPPPTYNNRRLVGRNEAPPRIVPISALNPYQGRWTIKARVTAKGENRRYTNARGEGKVFSFDLLDSDGEIRVTCFNAAVDQFYDQIEVGKLYLISGGNLNPAKKAFNHLSHEYEITFDNSSKVQLCYEDDDRIPRQKYNFRPISDIESMENKAVVDVIGVVSFISPAASIMTKNGVETQKRTLHLKDMSGRSVELTLWGSFCHAEGQKLQSLCDSGEFPILVVKAGKVSEFNGKAVGTISTTQLSINPTDIPEAHVLKDWFVSTGRNTPAVSISRETSSMGRTENRKTLSQIKDEKLGTSEKPDWVTVVARISFIKLDNFCYTACPIMNGDRQCNKKVTNNGDGKWWCDKCDRSVDECDYRYIIQLQIQDHTGLSWVTAFQEAGVELMGVPAKDLYHLRYENQDDEKFMEITRQIMYNKYKFKLKVKEEFFNDEQRVKSTIVKVEKVNFPLESRYLLDLIDKIKANDSGNFASKAEFATPNPGPEYTGVGIGGSRNTAPTTASMEYGLPLNQGGQYGNHYSGSRLRETASNMDVFCNSCGVTGHSSSNCPTIMNGPVQSTGRDYSDRTYSGASVGRGSGECFKCHQTGHWARDCPNAGAGAGALPMRH